MNEHDEPRDELEDRWTDQALAEVVGGKRPPDLTARILAAAQPRRFALRPRLKLALAASLLVAVTSASTGYIVTRQQKVINEEKLEAAIASFKDESGGGFPTDAQQTPGIRKVDRSHTSDRSDDSADENTSAETNDAALAERTRVQEKLAKLVHEFNTLMDEKRHAEAEVIAKRAYELAPNEPIVAQLRLLVKMVNRNEEVIGIRANTEQGFYQALTEVDRSSIPIDDNTPFIFGGNAKEWENLSIRRRKFIREGRMKRSEREWETKTTPILEGEQNHPSRELVIEHRLKTPILLGFHDAPLDEVLSKLSQLTQVPMILDPRGLAEEGVDLHAPVTIDLSQEISLKSALNLILSPLQLSYVIKDEVVKITSDDICQRERTVDANRDRYARIMENPFIDVTDNPLSTFSIDVDTASYAKTRRYIEQEGRLPPPDAVRIEEFVNYFSYDDAPPQGNVPFSAHVEVAACPWQPEHRLLRIGLKGKEIPRDERPAANLVFLLDVSGSMQPDDKLPRVRRAMHLLVEQLREQDRVAIVVYAAASGLVLPSTSGFQKEKIAASLDALEAGGSTNGGDGIRLAYDTAQASFIKGGTNRVVLCTDGDFNVGTTSNADLERLIEERAKGGVFLTVLGFGMGNHNDEMMEKLADKGNGNYGYVDGEREARKLLIEQAGGTLVTIAKDVKLQLEFNPLAVGAYRLIGYEDRMLRAEDFNDDKKDAGEIGAGHTVTALYELVPPGEPVETPEIDELKYQRPAAPTEAAAEGELLTLKLRYKDPDGETSHEPLVVAARDAGHAFARATADFKFASAVAGFGLLLRDSEFKGNLTYAAVLELAGEGLGPDPNGHRAAFVELVKKAKSLSE
ncbi:MAG TPA: VWA domain-containing protein [Pirellulales bacterium]|nr:VWA domain-containing protein [Pirellulales bacterium]